LDHEMTLFTFGDVMTSSADDLKTRFERIRLLLHRLNRVRDTAVEAEIITQLTLETEAVRRAQTATLPASDLTAPHVDRDRQPGGQQATGARPVRATRARKRSGDRTRGRTVRRAAR
jgi:hypothetical protein